MTSLNVWYYRSDDPEGRERPEVVRSVEGLDAVLDHVLAHPQPHPPVLVVRERPEAGDGFPDHQVKIDASAAAAVGALLCQGPADFAPDQVDGDPDGGTWVTWNAAAGAATTDLFIDKATGTPFPSSAHLPLPVWREAIRRLLHTGRRSDNVDWQDSEVY